MHLNNMIDAGWVTAHLTPAEALHCAQWAGGSGAKARAKQMRGVAMRTDDHWAWALWQCEMRRFYRHAKYLLEVYHTVRLQGQRRGDGGALVQRQRQRVMGPKIGPRVERIDALWAGQHCIAHWEQTLGCNRCGRTSCKGKRQARLKQWRQRCSHPKIHGPRLMRGQLVWQGQRKCSSATHLLSKNKCARRRRHRTKRRLPPAHDQATSTAEGNVKFMLHI